ncbi:MAG: hypothetical protein IJD57_05870 [Candidatus Gastranaerophilales bacterium]|nr:hypothetical protein [Candidatus Gastranaerophilales bacterium]
MRVNNINLNFRANKMSSAQAKYIDKNLQKAKSVDIFCHEDTDVDGAASAMVMSDYLKQKGISSNIVLSQNLSLLKLRNYDYNFIQAKNYKKNNETDTALCVDFSAKGRILPQTVGEIEKIPNKLGLDHHRGIDIVDGNYVYINHPLKDDEHVKPVVSFYVDSSAKSATSVLYRFFEALGEEPTDDMNYDMFYGLVDDCAKRNFVKCDGEKGTIVPTKDLIEDEHAYEVFKKLENKLTSEQIAQIAKKVDIISSLSHREEQFRKSLKNRLQYSPNGHIAYVEIASDDKEWAKLGADNTRTSTILNRFRQDALANKFNDEKLCNVKTVITFYRADDKYRMSLHSKEPTLLEFFKYIDKNSTTQLTDSMGGHRQRAGGKINTTNPKACHEWVLDIVNCDEFYN